MPHRKVPRSQRRCPRSSDSDVQLSGCHFVRRSSDQFRSTPPSASDFVSLDAGQCPDVGVLSSCRSQFELIMRTVLRLALVCAVLVPAPAAAQGFLESLFGGNSPPKPSPVPQALPPPLISPYGYRAPPYSPYRSPSLPSGDEAGQSRSGSYCTLCVRICYGFYWPISNAVSRTRFHRAATRCRDMFGE